MSRNNLQPIFDAYKRDNPESESGGWIQWKGTRVCIDLHCVCGFEGHQDAEFLYRIYCPNCGRQFLLGQNVKLIELTDEEAAVTYQVPQPLQYGDWTPEETFKGE